MIDPEKQAASARLSRREFCGQAAGLSFALALPMGCLAAEPSAELEPPGTWPMPRQNRGLTAIQPLPGRMKTAPVVAAKIAFPRHKGVLIPIALKPGAPPEQTLSLAYGALRCFDANGKLLWQQHPPGLNFSTFVAAEDLDGDGRVEIVMAAGRPATPLGAVVLLNAENGELRFRYDIEPMSYWWAISVDNYLPSDAAVGKQIVMVEHAYPPDEKFGYIVLFAFDKPGEKPKQRWRYDFDHYTCFPSILTADVDRDGEKELCVQTHSKMWVLKARTGQVHQFLEWDVSPANNRSYGLIRFQDLNSDGWPDFFCIANFAQHHEVLLNEKGQLKLAWVHGWDESVTIGTIATTWPNPPIADVDGDGKLEMVVSMFHAEKEPRWMARVYDAVTGTLKAKLLDRIAVQLTDLDGDGTAEILSHRSTDPTQTVTNGAVLQRKVEGNWLEVWEDAEARILPPRSGQLSPQERKKVGRNNGRAGDATLIPAEYAHIQQGAQVKRLQWEEARGYFLTEEPPAPPPKKAPFAAIPALVGPELSAPLVADIDGDGKNEVIHYHDGKVTLYRYRGAAGFEKFAEFASDGPPALADFDGDGKLEMAVGSVGPNRDPQITALRPGRDETPLWQVTLPKPNREGLPHGKPLTFQVGRFLGRKGYDLYVYVGTPLVRSMVLDGSSGALIWEKGEMRDLGRYYAPTQNLAAVWDVNGDGKDDLVFTCPDYYCVASGPTGEPLIGPAFPPKIFSQPSQGLYTLPAILPNPKGDPTVCLVNGHYFQAAMSIKAAPYWYKLPIVGDAPAGAEGFLKAADGTWLMGFGRQDGVFACVEVPTGKVRWQVPLRASASAVCAGDVDGDGRMEFVFGTSHGDLIALADDRGRPREVWRARLDGEVRAPILADVDNDGASEVLVALSDGQLCLLRPRA